MRPADRASPVRTDSRTSVMKPVSRASAIATRVAGRASTRPASKASVIRPARSRSLSLSEA